VVYDGRQCRSCTLRAGLEAARALGRYFRAGFRRPSVLALLAANVGAHIGPIVTGQEQLSRTCPTAAFIPFGSLAAFAPRADLSYT